VYIPTTSNHPQKRDFSEIVSHVILSRSWKKDFLFLSIATIVPENIHSNNFKMVQKRDFARDGITVKEK